MSRPLSPVARHQAPRILILHPLRLAEMSDNEYAVKFVRACSDKIGALVQFHDSPMPYFLFYMVRQRTGIARGA